MLPAIISGGPGAPPPQSSGGGGGGKGDSTANAVQLYHFDTIKTNLANPSTTLIIVKFSVKGSDAQFMDTIDQYRVPLTDATLKVLSLLTRIDTQSPGIQNVVKNDLITRFNQVLGRSLVEDLYFVDFVTQ
ncbi:MAG: flagellar basal body-associated protein FliL [Opitutales bacterium]